MSQNYKKVITSKSLGVRNSWCGSRGILVIHIRSYSGSKSQLPIFYYQHNQFYKKKKIFLKFFYNKMSKFKF